MLVFLNGKFVSEERAVVSVFDRSFTLSDGLFEAIPVYKGKLFLWEQHLARLQTGAAFLKIDFPFSPEAMRVFANKLIVKNGRGDHVLRIQLSRGIGPRGYSIKGATSPTVVMSLHPLQRIFPPAKMITSSCRIPANDPLARFKACNKLTHVLARMEADDQRADEALLLNTEGRIAEATSANLFWIERRKVFTTPLASGALPGVTRGLVLELCAELKIATVEKNISPRRLKESDGAFLTSIAVAVREISQIDLTRLPRSPLTERIAKAYWNYAKRAD
ncbi:MAG: aminotransferase class IV [Verrucomicrobiota bacterium]